MPTQTFDNLNEVKKKRVTDAIKKEFASKSIIDYSVKNIVENAKIARGSFYQYFTTKEEVIDYILGEEYRNEIEKIKEILIKNNGDLFKASTEYLILSLELSEEETQFNINIVEYLKDYAIYKIKYIDLRLLKEYINWDNINIASDEEYCATLSIIISLICITRLYILRKIYSKEEGLKSFHLQLDILKRGLLK